MQITTPDWVKHTVFYQIFPDRFARSARSETPPGITLKPWGAPPEEQGFQGGDLRGIVDKLDYLQELGIGAIYMTPIFSSAANHRYHTFDYMQVDPLLGGNEALRELLDEAHARNMKVVLDGVFNHASRGFWPFHHVLENGGNSPYLGWFTINGWPLRPYNNDSEHPHNYAAWWNLPALPKLNIKNPGVRQYILDVTRFWLEFGIDGWRLDVPEDIDDEDFWQDFRKVVKSTNPEAYICGEIWRIAPEWLQGDRFDALMNYPFGVPAMNFFAAETVTGYRKNAQYDLQPLSEDEFARKINTLFETYDWEVNQVQLNLLSSHDTPRALWAMGGDVSALKLCTFFQMTMPGAPSIYYGDEIGMNAPDDPGCREAFPWDNTASWNYEVQEFTKTAIELRHRYEALRTGSFHLLTAGNDIYAFGRKSGENEMIVVFNRRRETQHISLNVGTFTEPGTNFQAIYGNSGQFSTTDGEIRDIAIDERDLVILTNSPK